MRNLILVGIAVIVVVLGIYIVGRYQALAACTELDHRLDEAGRSPAPGVPASEASATERIQQLGGELRVDVGEVRVAFEPLTRENADTLSSQARQAVRIAAKLPNYVLQGTILQLSVEGRAKRLLTTLRCHAERRMLLSGQ